MLEMKKLTRRHDKDTVCLLAGPERRISSQLSCGEPIKLRAHRLTSGVITGHWPLMTAVTGTGRPLMTANDVT